MPTVTGRPLISEHHVIMSGTTKAIWVRFLSHSMPELEKSDWDVTTKRIDVSWRKSSMATGCDKCTVGMLRTMCPDCPQLLESDQIDPIRTVDAVLVQMRVIKQNPSEIVWQSDVRIQMQPPAMILPTSHTSIERRAFIEAPAIFAEQIGLNADGSMLLGDLLSSAILMAGDNDHRVQMRVVQLEGDIQKIVKTDTCGDGFKTEGFRRGGCCICVFHTPERGVNLLSGM